jgi:hypothetical protein
MINPRHVGPRCGIRGGIQSWKKFIDFRDEQAMKFDYDLHAICGYSLVILGARLRQHRHVSVHCPTVLTRSEAPHRCGAIHGLCERAVSLTLELRKVAAGRPSLSDGAGCAIKVAYLRPGTMGLQDLNALMLR